MLGSWQWSAAVPNALRASLPDELEAAREATITASLTRVAYDKAQAQGDAATPIPQAMNSRAGVWPASPRTDLVAVGRSLTLRPRESVVVLEVRDAGRNGQASRVVRWDAFAHGRRRLSIAVRARNREPASGTVRDLPWATLSREPKMSVALIAMERLSTDHRQEVLVDDGDAVRNGGAPQLLSGAGASNCGPMRPLLP
jgi:hypothetical protein